MDSISSRCYGRAYQAKHVRIARLIEVISMATEFYLDPKLKIILSTAFGCILGLSLKYLVHHNTSFKFHKLSII